MPFTDDDDSRRKSQRKRRNEDKRTRPTRRFLGSDSLIKHSVRSGESREYRGCRVLLGTSRISVNLQSGTNPFSIPKASSPFPGLTERRTSGFLRPVVFTRQLCSFSVFPVDSFAKRESAGRKNYFRGNLTNGADAARKVSPFRCRA